MQSSAATLSNTLDLRPTLLVTNAGRKPARYIPQLDGIRGIAVLVIMLQHVWGHWSALFTTDGVVQAVVKRGWVSVDLFFVLSGYLITGIVLRGSASATSVLKSFYLRRAVRIWPLYFALLGFVCIATRLLHQHYPLAPFFLFIQNFLPEFPKPSFFDQTWSLCVEEHFYLIWPLCVLFVPRRWLVGLLGLVIVASPLLRLWALESGIVTKLLYTSTQYRLDGIAMGSLLALLPSVYSQSAGRIHFFGRALLAVSLPSTAICLWHLSPDDLGFRSPMLYTLVALVSTGIVAVATSKESGLLHKLLTLNALRYVGRISYGLYMIHPFVFGAFRQRIPDARGPFAAVAVSLILASLSWHLFESRLLQIGKSRQ
jgi:peptidoglycan/LPS O-acetylase OafA/YrhL